MAAVVEDQRVGWVDPQKVKPLMQRSPQGGELIFVHMRHDEERRAGVELVPAAAQTIAASPRAGVLFEHGDVQTMLSQVGSGGDPTHTSADNEDSGLAHMCM